MKKKAQSYEGPLTKELSSYRKNQERLSKRPFNHCSQTKVISAINRSHVVYLGDFHTFDQNSKNLERIIKILMSQKKKLSLGVEFIHQRHQLAIDQYLDGHLTELEFLETIEYKDSWRFPWFYYKVFFEHAKENDFKIIALNTDGGLEVRDQNAAEMIADYLHNNKNEIMLVLFGEYHISPNKLPARVKKLMNKNLIQTIIHQNLDHVFWKLEANPKSPFIQFNDYEFSLQTSPPWIKYESMIYWYENLIEDPEFEIHQYMLTTGYMAFNSSVPDNFDYLCKEIAEALGIKIQRSHLEDFNIYDHQKLKYVEKEIVKIKSTSIRQLHQKFLYKGKMFKIPSQQIYYCSSYSINRLSYLAGIHLLDFVLKEQNPDYEDIWSRSTQSEKFIFLTYRFTIGYLASKIINPYRKCDLYLDLIKPGQTALTAKNAKLIKKIIDDTHLKNSKLSQHLKSKSLITLYYSASQIGHMFGDLIYDRHLSKKSRMTVEMLKTLFSTDFSEELFHSLLRKVMPEKSYKEYKKRIF